MIVQSVALVFPWGNDHLLDNQFLYNKSKVNTVKALLTLTLVSLINCAYDYHYGSRWSGPHRESHRDIYK